jgi:hypothetical protein
MPPYFQGAYKARLILPFGQLPLVFVFGCSIKSIPEDQLICDYALNTKDFSFKLNLQELSNISLGLSSILLNITSTLSVLFCMFEDLSSMI